MHFTCSCMCLWQRYLSRVYRSCEYTKLNPISYLPTLVDGDVITDSLASLLYTEEKYPRHSEFRIFSNNLGVVGLKPGFAGGLEGLDRIFVGGLPYYFTKVQIKEIFETFGPLRGFDLVKDRETSNSKGYYQHIVEAIKEEGGKYACYWPTFFTKNHASKHKETWSMFSSHG